MAAGDEPSRQFRYQVIGIAMGAVLAVVLAKIFISAYPVFKADQFGQHVAGAQQWQSAMTYKFVGALQGITNAQPHVMTALQIGIALGLVTETTRKLLKGNRRYQQLAFAARSGRAADFMVDAVFLPSPYASRFGGFVEITTLYWWAGGGALSSVFDTIQARAKPEPASSDGGEVPSDMSTMSLVGGGLIAGDSLAAFSLGIYGLLRTVL